MNRLLVFIFFLTIGIVCSRYNIKSNKNWDYYSRSNSDGATLNKLNIFSDSLYTIEHDVASIRFSDWGKVIKYRDSLIFFSYSHGKKFEIDTSLLFRSYDSAIVFIDTTLITIRNIGDFPVNSIRVYKDNNLFDSLKTLYPKENFVLKVPLKDFPGDHHLRFSFSSKKIEINFARQIDCELNVDTFRIIGPIFKNAKLTKEFMRYYNFTGEVIKAKGSPHRGD